MRITEKHFEAMLEFAQELVRQPSLMLAEGQVADLIERQMHQLGYDKVWRDELGNVLGVVQGKGKCPTIMLNGHMDHVEAANPQKWKHGPFDGYVDETFLHGRGSADMKASLAVMVHCAGLIRKLAGTDWPGRLIVAAVVLEETGVAIGTRHVLEKLRPDVAIVGEPTGNKLAIGHRGKGDIVATIRGRSCHASMPDKGANPLLPMAEFIKRISQMDLPCDELLGKATLTPTVLRTDQSSVNVIPSEAMLSMDYRSVPVLKPEILLAQLNDLLSECLTKETTGKVFVSEYRGKCYTDKNVEQMIWLPCFRMDPNQRVVRIAQKALSESLGSQIGPQVVSYASDASVLAEASVPTILFGPGEPSMAHVRDERIELNQMRQAAQGFLAMIKSLTHQLRN